MKPESPNNVHYITLISTCGYLVVVNIIGISELMTVNEVEVARFDFIEEVNRLWEG